MTLPKIQQLWRNDDESSMTLRSREMLRVFMSTRITLVRGSEIPADECIEDGNSEVSTQTPNAKML